MISLIEFARIKRTKDKKPKSRVSDIGLGASTIGATSLYGATTTIGEAESSKEIIRSRIK